VAPVLVGLAAIIVAGIAYDRFLQAPRHLWERGPHDRNAHYGLGLSLALDIRQVNLARLVHDLDGARVWGPLHGILVALTQVIGGVDYRLALLPSLAGWVLTAVFGFLLARRLVGAGGLAAGLLAALFILASPAHQAFATDIMLESLGAALSLIALYLYVVAVQEPTPRSGRWLGMVLTLLFLHKYNYWLLVTFGLAATEVLRRPKYYGGIMRDAWGQASWRDWLAAQLRQPLNYLLVLAVALAGWVLATGGGSFRVLGRPISVRSPHNFVYLAYVALFLRGWLWWRRHGRVWARGLETPLPQIVSWHVWPIALWFLLPKRLAYFLWYLSPANGPNSEPGFVNGLHYYWSCLTEDYHPGLISVLLALGFAGLAFLSWRRLKPGGNVVFCFLLLAALLTIHHPNRKSRFLHSWVAVTWVAAGAGLAQALCGLTRRQPRARTCLTFTGIAALSCVFVPEMLQARTAPDGGSQYDRPSNLDLTDVYLPDLVSSRRALILCDHVALKHLARWTYLERYPGSRRVEVDLKGFGHDYAKNRQVFHKWLKTTRCDTLVFIHLPPGSSFYVDDNDFPYEQVHDFLDEQSAFRFWREYRLGQYGCSVAVWKRK
jgi:hypothetical protein